LTQCSDGSQLYDFYILTRNKKVALFFIRKAL
jgi:hypothetical protein